MGAMRAVAAAVNSGSDGRAVSSALTWVNASCRSRSAVSVKSDGS